MYRYAHLRHAAALVPVLLLAQCASSAVSSVETDVAKSLISDDQEKQIGLEVKQELETKQHVRYLEDPVVTGYVRGVAGRILTFAMKDRPGLTWNVNVIDDPKTVNAFATPGGFLYVYTGLLLAANNEAELAGVMGHESGHVVAHHSARQIVEANGLEAVTALALGENPGLLAQLAAAVATKGALLAHSRTEEDEADTYGARYAATAGYDPHALITFFEKLQALYGSTSGISTWLSDHPATDQRIAHIKAYIAEHGLKGSDLGAERFAPIKARLQARRP